MLPEVRHTRNAPMATPHRIFDDLFSSPMRLLRDFDAFGEAAHEGARVPKVETRERDGNLLITAEMPGMSENDVDVRVEGGVLKIVGEKAGETEERDGAAARSWSRFERAIPVGTDVDPDKVEAELRDGVLTLTVPKSETAGGKRIPVRRAA